MSPHNPPAPRPPRRPPPRSLLLLGALLLLAGCPQPRTQMSYSNFLADLEDGKVIEVVITGETAFVSVVDDPRAAQRRASSYEVRLPADPAQTQELTDRLRRDRIPFEVRDS